MVDADGNVILATAAAGGSRITTGLIQTVQRALDYGVDPTANQLTPRWHDQLGNSTLVEFNPGHGIPSFSNETASYLTSLRYNITDAGSANAAVQSACDRAACDDAPSRCSDQREARRRQRSSRGQQRLGRVLVIAAARNASLVALRARVAALG